MLQSTTKIVCILLVVMFIVFSQRGWKPQKASAAADPVGQQDIKSDKQSRLRRLYVERKEMLEEDLKQAEIEIKMGQRPSFEVTQYKIALLTGDLDLCDTVAERIEIHKTIVLLHKTMESEIERAIGHGRVSASELYRIKVKRIQAEIELVKEEINAAP